MSRFGLEIGDRVIHIHKGWIGIVAGFMKRNNGVMVNLSNERGIRFRWIDYRNLRLIDEMDKD